VFDHDEEQGEPGRVDWDAWERNRFTGWRRWWVILLAAMAVAGTLQFLVHGTGS
jgi:hypothetical protein